MHDQTLRGGAPLSRYPTPSAVLELLKPITWFPPMWAYACGAVSIGVATDRLGFVALGVLLAGPMVCGTSQAINDWFDRHVDAINEPHRVVPSGRMPGRSALYVAILGSLLSLALAAYLGPWVLAAACVGIVMAWGYSAPPLRFKLNGWWGNGAVGLSYETLPWVTAATVALGDLPPWPILSVALLYGIGAHGIMTLNDFKAIEGDKRMGVASLPVQLGPKRAALLAVCTMIVSQAVVLGILVHIQASLWSVASIGMLGFAQLIAARRLVRDPIKNAIWYSALGVGLYVTGMMIAAFALNSALSVVAS